MSQDHQAAEQQVSDALIATRQMPALKGIRRFILDRVASADIIDDTTSLIFGGFADGHRSCFSAATANGCHFATTAALTSYTHLASSKPRFSSFPLCLVPDRISESRESFQASTVFHMPSVWQYVLSETDQGSDYRPICSNGDRLVHGLTPT
jgi:hypothetical protein